MLLRSFQECFCWHQIDSLIRSAHACCFVLLRTAFAGIKVTNSSAWHMAWSMEHMGTRAGAQALR